VVVRALRRRHDAADRFVARHERIAHAREGRHGAGVEQALGTGADTAPLDLHDQVLSGRRIEQEMLQTELLRC
jgi:hypothetical protein